MATKVRVKKKTAVKAKPGKKAARTKASNNGKLTVAERHRLAKCKAPGDEKCPAVNGKDSPFMYQSMQCRAEPCRLANRKYYQDYRARKAAEEAKAKAARARKRKQRAAVSKKTTKKAAPRKTVKKTTAKKR